jgi:hypothetical protein
VPENAGKNKGSAGEVPENAGKNERNAGEVPEKIGIAEQKKSYSGISGYQ